MYIAFKWLVGLSLAMWVAVCCRDIMIKINKNAEQGSIARPFGLIFKNTTIPKEKILEHRNRFKHDSIAVLHCSMFLAGALAVTIFNRKTEIILFAKSRIRKVNLAVFLNKVRLSLNETAIGISVSILKYYQILGNIGRILSTKLINALITLKQRKMELNTVNFILLKKLKELGEERKNLGQLLISAIHENKNIRMQYQLESLAKSRLMRHITQSQNQMKENRSRYVSFQQLYLVTHQENLFLKARVRKLTKEKEEVQKNLMELMNEIYKSKNTELKAYCSRFIVSSRDNLLNSDVKSEIQKFLQNSRRPRNTRSRWEMSDEPEILVNSTRSWPRCNDTRVTEIHGDESVVPIVSDAPKLKGLPGECVWTVKDKDGIIEKLYEYDYETDFDNGDTIRRIREYSVYYDKDCLLDFSNSRTTMPDDQTTTSEMNSQCYSRTSQRFLTGSEAFQKFLQANTEIVSSPRRSSQGPPFLCG
ncbi:hypothetical protein O3G_MSEX005627 [Manduca sexta]|uniref:Uncharacterized protein n=1 Tax=Manduca sexta TaxID=7130 RepID=A0A921YZB2_MANSE|nr:hypothetical protein O3G_MSEX005627 [Manduca sexta]